jgi:signal transduction histidine kinase
VKHVYQDTTGILWVGTEGGGLNRVDLRGADSLGTVDITVYRERDGLYQNQIHQVLEDEQGRLWMNTNNGLFWVRKQNLNAFARGEIDHVRSVSYGLRDGLRNVEGSGYGMPSAIKAQDGRLWFPTLGGAAVVNPRRLGDHTSPLVHVKALTTGNRSLFEGTWGGIPDTSLSLSADQRTFTIQYAGIYLRDPDAVEYRYRLQDMQEEWVRAQSRREVTFSEVPPGRYTFEVLARAEGGSWSKEPAQLTVTVAPYFYETWWFYGLCITLLGAIGYGGIQYRLYALRRREALLEETVAERTRELQERERELKRENERLDRFASVLSHDLRNPLNVAQGRLQLAKEQPAKEDGEDREDHLSSAEHALGRMDEIIEDMLLLTWSEQEIDPEDLGPVELETVAREAWDNVEAPRATLEIKTSEVETSAGLRGHEGRLRRLLENLFRNAAEHGGEAVSISVGLLPEEKPPNGGLPHGESPAGFFVEDDGPGIPEEKREKVLEGGYSSREEGTGLGLSIVQGIAEAHGWSISITEGREGGARFEFRGPEMPGG